MDTNALKPFAWSRRSAIASALLAPLVAPFIITACKSDKQITGNFTGTSPARGHQLRSPAAAAAPSKTHRVHTLIAGGGVAGLSAARALRLQGMEDFAVLELEDAAGGNARSGAIAGMAHPLGAHYLPVPTDSAPEVQDFLEELGLRQRVAGRWQYDERHLCHSPQERLFFNGAWQDGLLPLQGVGQSTLAQYAHFAALVEQWRNTGLFRIPVRKMTVASAEYAQLAIHFAAYLDVQGLTDPHLRWYLDYCCRDDYGAGTGAVSTWAGLHYFAARHGFHVPGESDTEPKDGVLTWPEGNAHFTHALAKPLGDRVKTGHLILRIEEARDGVTVDALNMQTQAIERWQAARCIVALPVFIAHRVVVNPPIFLHDAAQRTTYSSWLVANIHINAPLHDTPGAAPSWDNVVYGQTQSLGYVDAMHQSTRIAPGSSVLTYYRALGSDVQARRDLLAKSWVQHRDEALADLAAPHPDIYQRAVHVDITRYGHAMAVPTPDFVLKNPWRLSGPDVLSPVKLSPAARLQHPYGFNYQTLPTPSTTRLRFAHSDWSGYSVFEEAFTRGLHAGLL